MAKEGKKGAKKVAKKVAKRVAKDKPETNGATGEENVVTLATLATEAKMSGAVARRKLRDAELKRDGRWSWEEGSKDLKKVREVLGLEAA